MNKTFAGVVHLWSAAVCFSSHFMYFFCCFFFCCFFFYELHKPVTEAASHSCIAANRFDILFCENQNSLHQFRFDNSNTMHAPFVVVFCWFRFLNCASQPLSHTNQSLIAFAFANSAFWYARINFNVRSWQLLTLSLKCIEITVSTLSHLCFMYCMQSAKVIQIVAALTANNLWISIRTTPTKKSSIHFQLGLLLTRSPLQH